MDVGGVGEAQSFQAALNVPERDVVPPQAQRQEGGSEDRDNTPNRVDEADRARRTERLESQQGPVTSEEIALRRQEVPRQSEPEPERGPEPEDPDRLDVRA